MTADQLDRFLRIADGQDQRHYPLFLLLARTGLRIGEALGVKWSDCSVGTREIHVRRTLAALQRGTPLEDRAGSPKSGRARTVDLSRELAQVLTSLEVAQKADALRRGTRWTSSWLFTTHEGTPLDESRVRKAFKSVLKQAALPTTLSPHCLRHTYAILMIAAGAPLTYVRDQLGHSSIQVTVDIYGRWLPRGDKTWVDRLDPSHGQGAVRVVGGENDRGVPDPDGDQLVTSLDSSAEVSPQVVDLNGAGERTRTADLLITNQLLYQLSYAGPWAGVGPRAGLATGAVPPFSLWPILLAASQTGAQPRDPSTRRSCSPQPFQPVAGLWHGEIPQTALKGLDTRVGGASRGSPSACGLDCFSWSRYSGELRCRRNSAPI